ncbi:hypothetical protein BJG92_00711 [Arthrobacter sp. SO5]|uniref:aggregation-promoting factor C-terminal-like domain-containing protein n=1 Tax=Arthrobacter sp. SO5 TaxID=1897055 RepID=UPI001E287346|nr:hypothetical protein [Arthrobacter sp. SO5]MCB5273196.1 hypothetical protein [Arthrobacter sp. SO5]
MTDFKVHPRPEGDSRTSRAASSRHRAEPAKPASALSRFTAGLGSTGRRAALVATACAVLVGVGASGQAADTANHSASDASSTAAPSTAAPLTHLDFERVRVTSQEALPSVAGVAPQSAKVKPAEAPAPAPAPEPAPAPAPAPEPAKPVAVDDPAGAQAYAAAQLGSYGWAPSEMQCLLKLWTKESDWKTTATNASSGAYGVVQSLPAEKMASAGADYRTNYRTQINWGLNYVKQRYGSPCGALNFHYANNWY